MTNASVKPSLKRIERGITEIKEKLCEISPCEPQVDDAVATEPSSGDEE